MFCVGIVCGARAEGKPGKMWGHRINFQLRNKYASDIAKFRLSNMAAFSPCHTFVTSGHNDAPLTTRRKIRQSAVKKMPSCWSTEPQACWTCLNLTMCGANFNTLVTTKKAAGRNILYCNQSDFAHYPPIPKSQSEPFDLLIAETLLYTTKHRVYHFWMRAQNSLVLMFLPGCTVTFCVIALYPYCRPTERYGCLNLSKKYDDDDYY